MAPLDTWTQEAERVYGPMIDQCLTGLAIRRRAHHPLGGHFDPVVDMDRFLLGITCSHPRMKECCKGCGHWHCPDCDVRFDDEAGC